MMRTIFLLLLSIPAFGQQSACDLAAPFGVIDAADVQAAVSMSLGLAACSGTCNIALVQTIANATLPGGRCALDPVIVPHSAILSWTASVTPAVLYNVYRRAATGTYSRINSAAVGGTTYVDDAVEAGGTYYYVARAVDANGNESVDSNEVQAIIPFP